MSLIAKGEKRGERGEKGKRGEKGGKGGERGGWVGMGGMGGKRGGKGGKSDCLCEGSGFTNELISCLERRPEETIRTTEVQ